MLRSWNLVNIAGDSILGGLGSLGSNTPEAQTWSLDKETLYRGSQIFASFGPEGLQHYTLDHLGTPRMVANAEGHKVSTHAYYPYGVEISIPNTLSQKFTGHERDSHGVGVGDDLDYMHARYCDPEMGRFLSVDPVLGRPAMPQSWNRFRYARSNPQRFIDGDDRQEGAAIRQDRLMGELTDGGAITPAERAEYFGQLRSDAAAAAIGVAGVAAVAYGPSIVATARIALWNPTFHITTAQIFQSFADDLQSGGGASSVTLFSRLDSAPEAGRALSVGLGEKGKALANQARATGAIYTAKIPKPLLKSLLNASLAREITTSMNGVTATEIRFSAEATEHLADLFQAEVN